MNQYLESSSHWCKGALAKFVRSLADYSMISLVFILFFNLSCSAQEVQKKFTTSGYISDLQSVMFDSIHKQWNVGNLLHNRVNLKYFPVTGLSMALEWRNRLSVEESATGNSATAANFSTDNGLFHLSKNIGKGNSYVLNSTIDRLWVAYERGKLHATIGRQRINWGQTMVWNPNDIFNAYSFFDFDYVERPGSDALRLQYYNTEVSSMEMAVKMNYEKKITAAALYKFNVFEYDFQLLGGTLEQKDYVAGFGWSGAIHRISFRGEVSYFHPEKNFKDTTGVVLASVSFDYTLGNSFTLLAEYLYDGANSTHNLTFQSFYNAPLSVKNLSFVKHNIVIQASYPITPLLNGSLACMILPEIKGYYVGPSLTYSLTQNLDASLFVQSFGGSVAQQKVRLNMIYFRLKYSF